MKTLPSINTNSNSFMFFLNFPFLAEYYKHITWGESEQVLLVDVLMNKETRTGITFHKLLSLINNI